MRWTKAANIVVLRNKLKQDLRQLNPELTRNGSTEALIALDVPDERSATDQEAGEYALKVLNEVLIPDDDAVVESVALDIDAEPDDSASVPELEKPAAVPDEEEPLDVDEVPPPDRDANPK